MSESRKITVAKADDWIMVFADDRCILSQHSATAVDLLEALDYEDYQTAYFDAATYDEADEVSDLFWGEPSLSEFNERVSKARANGFTFGSHE